MTVNERGMRLEIGKDIPPPLLLLWFVFLRFALAFAFGVLGFGLYNRFGFFLSRDGTRPLLGVQLCLQLFCEHIPLRVRDAGIPVARWGLRLAFWTFLVRRHSDKIRSMRLDLPTMVELKNSLFEIYHIILRLPQGLLHHVYLWLVHTPHVPGNGKLPPPNRYTVPRMRRKVHEDNHDLGRVVETNRFLQGLVQGIAKHIEGHPVEDGLRGVVGKAERRVCE